MNHCHTKFAQGQTCFLFSFSFIIWLLFKVIHLKYKKNPQEVSLKMWFICISKSFTGKEYMHYIYLVVSFYAFSLLFFHPHLGFNFLM